MSTASARTARVGIDVLDSSELRRLIKRPWFLRFSFAPEELRHAESMGAARRLEFLAGRFAAKEALFKALGFGFLQGIAPREICVEPTTRGAPAVRFTGRAAQLSPRPRAAVSITHKQNVVAAVAIGIPQDTTTAADQPRHASEAKEPDAVSPTATDTTVPAPQRAGDESDLQTTAFLRVRIGQEEAHYGGGLVDGARILRLFGDLVTEITIRTDGDEGLLAQYDNLRFTAPVKPGDYIEARARLVRQTRLRRVVELEAHKVVAASSGAGASAASVLDAPQLVCAATATTVVPRRKTDTVTASNHTAKES
ncbi:4'-phosphopantetheinyl transferase superfamily protein [Streptomyces flavidovirens]|uniref:4'-phosphopantetheinyl transferase superfamily protein n=1 Tax=Streptomyces flavidovirens TaxID=67298 RepID=UPI0034210BD0